MDPHEKARIYYEKYFPVELLCKWLTYGNNPASPDPHLDSTMLSRREFSFFLQGDIYVRHQSFASPALLKQKLVTDRPMKIDIGAVWRYRPGSSSTVPQGDLGVNAPLERELVFDIDMTDYDSIRYCCQGPQLCSRCWKFLEVACKCINKVLEGSFGYRDILWVYSGRRGVHCWVSDPEARRLNDQLRKELVSFITSGSEWSHSPFTEIYTDVLVPYFKTVVLEDQDVFSRPAHRDYLNGILEQQGKRERLVAEHSGEVWDNFLNCFAHGDAVVRGVMFKYLYPRIDVHVSTGMNHLLKAPFSIHPATGKCCVPILPDQIEHFDVDSVPALDDLVLGKVSLALYTSIFSEFIERCVERSRTERLQVLEFLKVLQAESGEF